MGSWRQLAALPGARHNAAACWHDGKVYFFGGQAGYPDGSFQNTLYIYDPSGNTWTTGAVMPATGLCYAFSTAADGIHVVFPAASGAHFAYTPTTNTWATRTFVPGPARLSAHHFADADGRIYLAAERDTAGSDSVKVDRYDPTTDSWTSLGDAPAGIQSPARSPGVLGSDGKIYLAYETQPATLLVYDPATNAWSYTPSMPIVTKRWPQLSRLASGVVLALPSPPVKRTDGYSPASGSWSLGVIPDFPGSSYLTAVATEPPGGLIYLLGGVADDSSGVANVTAQAWMYKQNEPPTVATLLTMTGGVLVSTAVINRARHQFNDPNAGDSQSKADHRWRKVGDPTWITETVISPNPWRDFPAGSLTAGSYERQVLTYDAAGEPAPAWTPSGFFTAGDPPAGPVITYPIDGQLLEQVERVDWSTPSQEAYQVRRVADDGAGSPVAAPVGADIYFETGEVVDTLARTLPLTFETNGRTEHIQVNVKDVGLWSGWVSSVRGDVSYTPPPAPTFTPYPDPSTASLLLMITNPAPVGGEPAAAYNDVYITDPDPNTGQVVERRLATQVATNTPWRYNTPVGSWDYEGNLRVVAVAANGTTASST